MQDYYCDSTDMGQLYLSYPSVEAYRDFDPFEYSSLDDALVPSEVLYGQRSYKEWVARRGDSLADIGRIDGYTFACIIAVHALRSLWLTNGQVMPIANESLADLAATVAGINHSELLLNEIDRLNNDSFCACCTCLFFIANWPKRLNDVLNKAIKRGLGIRLFYRVPFALYFRKCGEKSETAEHNQIFGNKTAGRGSIKQGSGRLISVLPRTSEIARRKYAANSGTPEHTAIFEKRNRR